MTNNTEVPSGGAQNNWKLLMVFRLHHDRPQPTCQEVGKLLTEYLVDPSDMAPDQRQVVESHLVSCPHCKLIYEMDQANFLFIREYGEAIFSEEIVPEPVFDEEIEGFDADAAFDVEAGLQDLFRRYPDLANAYRKQMRQKRLHKLLRYAGMTAAAAACLMIAVFLSLHTSTRQIASEQHVPAHAVATQPVAGLRATEISGGVEDLRTLVWSDDGPATVSLATLDYKSWRNENREWFSRQFPQIFQVQEVLATKYSIQADYIELLMVSGDIWQFPYDPKNIANQPMAILTAMSVERIARRYNVQTDGLAAAISSKAPLLLNSPTQSNVSIEDISSANLQKWGRDMVAALNSPKGIRSEMQISMLQTGTYLGKTRTAAYLWIRDNRLTAMQLISEQKMVAQLLDGAFPVSVDKWLERLEVQSQAASHIARSGEHLIMAPATDSCTLLPSEFRMPVAQALETLMPKNFSASQVPPSIAWRDAY